MSRCETSQCIVGGLVEGDDGLYDADVVCDELVVAVSAIYRFAGTREDEEMLQLCAPLVHHGFY